MVYAQTRICFGKFCACYLIPVRKLDKVIDRKKKKIREF